MAPAMARETMAELIVDHAPDYRVAFAGDSAGASRESWSDDGALGHNRIASGLPTTRQLSVHNGNPGQAVQTPAVRQISNQNPEPPGRLPPASPKLIGYLGNAG